MYHAKASAEVSLSLRSLPRSFPTKCLGIDETAAFLSVARITVCRQIERKKLKASRVGDRVIITPDALAQFLEANPA